MMAVSILMRVLVTTGAAVMAPVPMSGTMHRLFPTYFPAWKGVSGLLNFAKVKTRKDIKPSEPVCQSGLPIMTFMLLPTDNWAVS